MSRKLTTNEFILRSRKVHGNKYGYSNSEYVNSGTKITITGPDKHAVGQFAANVRDQRRPEPYNGKGIIYEGEIVIRKQGKVFGA